MFVQKVAHALGCFCLVRHARRIAPRRNCERYHTKREPEKTASPRLEKQQVEETHMLQQTHQVYGNRKEEAGEKLQVLAALTNIAHIRIYVHIVRARASTKSRMVLGTHVYERQLLLQRAIRYKHDKRSKPSSTTTTPTPHQHPLPQKIDSLQPQRLHVRNAQPRKIEREHRRLPRTATVRGSRGRRPRQRRPLQ